MNTVRRLRRYVRENPGAPFIVGFMALLVAAAAALAVDETDLANTLAEYAYYSLVVGVLAQLIALIREERGKRELTQKTT